MSKTTLATSEVSDVPADDHQAELAARLQGSTQALREFIGTLPALVVVLDRDLKTLFANRGTAGRTVEQLEGAHVSEYLPTHVRERALTTMRGVLATGKPDAYTGELEDPPGHTRYFDVRVSAIRRAQDVIGLIVHGSETTQQVHAERVIATQSRMIDSMLEGVALIDERGVIDLTNPAFDAMFGYVRGELNGREMSTLAGWPFGQRERWQMLSHAGSGSMTVEFDARRRDGGHFAAAGVLSGLDIAGRALSLLVLQDVSERKHLERAVLQAVNREQYRIGNDLHDGLGQELTGVALMLRGLAGRLATEYPPILPEIEGITRLVNNAIESTRALARGLSPVNLERGGLQDALEGLSMHATELYGVPTVFTHRLGGQSALGAELANHLYRIAQEAVRNAVRHGKARSIRLHLTTARAKVRLSITDDGVGMPEDALDASGMGLKIMCYRARMLGGDVSFEEAEPSGTKVVCECPLETAAGVRVGKVRKSRAPL
ncbi:PAS domain S-box-containing protein [Povalibacter uvarum]|uniref:PAS domain S-box-containing protein n=1 Tax=Povalibacter uvarum TaxID=732238 RepID=A0A841HK58_9GAMM|nr:PAS domain S-box protein [Povalibacter uvarum]MBB6092512.1 PAS domain S-box-containing protein [Povalibacter uvarum]